MGEDMWPDDTGKLVGQCVTSEYGGVRAIKLSYENMTLTYDVDIMTNRTLKLREGKTKNFKWSTNE